MATVTPPEIPAIPPFPIHRFTVAEYDELTRLGILTEDSNVELLEGWIVPKMTKHPPHDNRIDVLLYLLLSLLPEGWFIRTQNCVVTDDSVPESDLAVVRGAPGDYENQHPRGTDIALIVEVADATVRRDRAKAAIYARAGVPLYWIVNLDDGQIEVYSSPRGRGPKRAYQPAEVLRGKDELRVVIDGRQVGKLAVRDILPR